MAIVIYMLIGILFILGLVGSFLPAVPGGPLLVFLGALIFGFWDGFNKVGFVFLGILLAIALVSTVIDFLASAWGARKYGASRAAAIGSIVGGLLGLVVGGLLGLLGGVFVGAFMAELVFSGKDGKLALKAGFGSLLGFLTGTIVKVLVSLVMIMMFVLTVT